jgi:colanic acid biosynthesis glycosyl transferase WcaI
LARGKIIFVNRVYWPSAAATAQLLTDLAEGLAARGHEVHVIASGDGDAERLGVTIHRTGGDAAHAALSGQVRNYGRFLLRARRRLLHLADAGDVVVLKTDPPLLGALLTGTAVARGARVVHWLQDIYPEIVAQHLGVAVRPLLAPLAWLRNRAWQRAAHCVVVGEDMRATVRAEGVPAARVSVRPNWAPRELDLAAPGAAIAAQRQAWSLADKFIVAYSGNLGRVHEFSTLLEAAERLREQPQLAFAFIGGGARVEEVRREVARRQLNNVRLFPPAPRDGLAASLGAADLQVVTLRPGFEPLVNPSKLAGILAAGRPALFVGPPRSALAALLEREGCGVTVANGAAAELAQAILALSRDPARLHALRVQARGAFERHFRYEAQLTGWERLLAAARG